ncbi:Lrp/AsnC family transcriptional regulator [Cryobacterium sp. PH31-O1]|uniref:Lrp/AsnC family transcriptional regulator n=1 Tax=Cryobacterium sp. PH31-O1 TaxID=3046306 RepID=UPI0024BAEC0C|nr:Lrp/AsnC family transcriptional regulator [Cryobacterium sp. PH31-O1]MDJ0337314.1 Lrp/AsnC family transcriptional regulator [Cryobacterium sp. PH31-O1]
MDEIDSRLVELLTIDGRATLGELATEVHLSGSAVKRRIDRLTATGVIKAFTIALGHDQQTVPFQAFVLVSLSRHVPANEVTRSLKAVPAAQTAYKMSGPWDWIVLLSAQSASEIDGAVDAVRSLGIVRQTETGVVLAEVALGR